MKDHDDRAMMDALIRVRQLVTDIERRWLTTRTDRWYFWRVRIAHWVDKSIDGTVFVAGMILGVKLAFWLGWLPFR